MSCSDFQVDALHGGTGVDGSSAPNGSLLIGNGSGYTLGTVTAGSGVGVSNGAGTITLSNTGVTSITLTQPAAGLTLTNTGVTQTGAATAVFALANDLAALEALAGTNTIYYRSGTDTWTAVTIGTGLSFSGGTLSATGGGTGTVTSVNLTAPAAGITVSGGPITTSGSITLALADDLAALEALAGTNTIYYRSGASTWTAVTIGTGLAFSGGTLSATGGSGTVTSVNLTAPAAGITVAGGPITTSGSITLTLADDLAGLEGLSTTGIAVRTAASTWTTRSIDPPAAGITINNPGGVAGNPTLVLANDLAAVEGLAGTGLAVRTATDTWTNRTITGTTNQITVTNGDGVSGNPTVAISASYQNAVIALAAAYGYLS